MTEKRIEVMPGAQAGFVLSEALFPAYVAGRRGGKTSASVIKMWRYMEEHPGAYFMFTTPTLGDVERILLPKMREFFGPWYGTYWGWLEKKSQIVFPHWKDADGGGGICFVRPATEPETMRGPTLAAAAMDEIGVDAQEEAFKILLPAVLGGQPGYPHQIWVTTTPNLEAGARWMKSYWVDHVNTETGEAYDAADYPLFLARTVDNIHLPEAAKAAMIAQYGTGRRAMRELDAQFITLEGLAFEYLDPAVHFIDPPPNTLFVRTVYGFDFGVTAPTAIIEWKQDQFGNRWATDEFYKAEADEYEWVKWLADRNAKRIMCDPAVSDKQLDWWLTKYGIRMVRAADKTFRGRWDMWNTGLLNQGRNPTIFITRKAPNLWDEIINLAYEHVGGRQWSEDKWAKGSLDHAYDGGAYGLEDFVRLRVEPVQISGVP